LKVDGAPELAGQTRGIEPLGLRDLRGLQTDSSRLREQTLAERLGHRLGFRMHMQTHVDVSHVEANCVQADPELSRRRFVPVAIRQQTKDFEFSWR
jgi:hypothetical protein